MDNEKEYRVYIDEKARKEALIARLKDILETEYIDFTSKETVEDVIDYLNL